MEKALLLRTETSSQGTFGLLQSGGFSVWIAELPWKENIRQLSCIPVGSYTCKWIKSPKFGWCYEVTGVANRGNILIHKGNFVGDSTLGYKTNSHGCLLPARSLGKLSGQRAGLLSLPATQSLYQHFKQQPFILEIVNAYNNSSPS